MPAFMCEKRKYTQTLYDFGVQIATRNEAFTGSVNGSVNLLEGNAFDGNGTYSSRSKIMCLHMVRPNGLLLMKPLYTMR
jgi:hypothetical protein